MSLLDRVAGAPISWGVCEVPGWGRELPAGRVLAEMSSLGLQATELGPDGYLPADPVALRELLAEHGLRLLAGFVPAVLHRADALEATVDGVAATASSLAASGADVLVVAAASGESGYETRPHLDDAAWDHIALALDRLARVVSDTGLDLAVHPHVGTAIEGPADVDRLLDRTRADLCVDTGHLLIGGSDPLAVVQRAGERVRHVHLKDVDGALAQSVRSGHVGYLDAVRRGLYRPLGLGDAPVAAVVAALERAGYRQWYVLEQDASLTGDEPPAGTGPADDVRSSLEFLRVVDRQLGTATNPLANATALEQPVKQGGHDHAQR
jgi:inosose dehydratase